VVELREYAFDERKHPRHKRGDKRGGQFAKVVGAVSADVDESKIFKSGSAVHDWRTGRTGKVVSSKIDRGGGGHSAKIMVRWDDAKKPEPVETERLSSGEKGRAKPEGIRVERRKDEKGRDSGWNDVGDDVNEAAKLLAEGKKVRLSQPSQVSVLLDKLAEMVKDANERGEKAPNYDLCNVTVRDTNLFCAESKGIPRIKMPQLKGKPLPGSKAAKKEPDKRGEVDLTPEFRAYLEKKGIAVEDDTLAASHFRPTQNELNGAKVAGMVQAIREGKLARERLFVSRDDYIVDGHHRWAGLVGADAIDGKLGDEQLDVARFDLDIITLLKESNDFAKEWGIPQVGVGEGVIKLSDCGCLSNLA